MKDNTIFPIVFTIALSIGIALFAYFLVIHFVVDGYPQGQKHYNRVNNLLDFYEQPHEGDIFILGSSVVTEGIDAFVIEESFKKKQINRSVYNLGIHGDTLIERLGHVDYIIASRPKIVVIGITHQYFNKHTTTVPLPDHVLLPYSRKQINIEEFQSSFSNEQLKQLNIPQNQFEYYYNRFFDKRKFILSSGYVQVRDLLFGNKSNEVNKLQRFPDLYMTNFKDPWVSTTNLTEAEKKEGVLIFGKNLNPISGDLDPQKMALLYIIKKFNQNNISIIIINMPMNHMESETINESSRYNLSNFLNSTGVPWYDYEREYPSEYFADFSYHMNIAGRTDFSQKVATIIADNLIKGA